MSFYNKTARSIILAILGLIFIILSLVIARGIIASKKAPAQETNTVVNTAFVQEVKNSSIAISLNANGNVEATNRVEIYSEVQGIFESSTKNFKEGTQFKAGQTLLKINGAEFYSSIVSERSKLYNLLAGAMPDLKLDYPSAFVKWNNYLSNFDPNQNLSPLPAFDNDQEQFFISGQNIVSTYHAIKNMEIRYSKYQINAPFTGVLTEALVNPGTLVNAGQKLGTFIDVSNYEMKVSIPQTYKDYLATGKTVTLSALNGTEEYQGKVVRVNSAIDAKTQMIDAFIQIKSKGVYEGMYLKVNVEAKPIENAFEINRKLLIENKKVFMVDDSVLQYLEVNPVHFTDETVIIDNIENGTVILSKNIPGAYPGMKVTIAE